MNPVTAALLESLTELRATIVYDEEGDLTREEFDAMLERADAAKKLAWGEA